MNAADYADYIDCFNRNDFDGFGKYYCEDVVFELGEKKRIVGRENILDFYREVKARIRETLDILSVSSGPDSLAVHVATEFYALEDWPDFIAGPLMKGDALNIESLGYYYLRDGKFARILGARLKTASVVKAGG